MPRPKVGLIGGGMIAQVMHLPYLKELEERFEIAALCDVSPGLVQALGRDTELLLGFVEAYTRGQSVAAGGALSRRRPPSSTAPEEPRCTCRA